jgi:hypothetical protein
MRLIDVDQTRLSKHDNRFALGANLSGRRALLPGGRHLGRRRLYLARRARRRHDPIGETKQLSRNSLTIRAHETNTQIKRLAGRPARRPDRPPETAARPLGLISGGAHARAARSAPISLGVVPRDGRRRSWSGFSRRRARAMNSRFGATGGGGDSSSRPAEGCRRSSLSSLAPDNN